MKINFAENKIIYTNNYFEFLLNLENINDFLIINPFSKVSEILNFKSKSFFNNFFMDEYSINFLNLISHEKINEMSNDINQKLGFEFVSTNLDLEKNTKSFLEIDKDLLINEINILNILKIIDKYSNETISILIYGIKLKNFSEFIFNKLNIIYLIDKLAYNLSFENIEQLVFANKKEIVEIFDKEKLINYLESGTKTLITVEKINNYLKGEESFDSFLINKFLEKI
ncbi:hypothetical protein [[Mycoplasma] mobile]|nr:hypothetical protein [[Mycoplasma] mobile]